jgi:hypothetical protein
MIFSGGHKKKKLLEHSSDPDLSTLLEPLTSLHQLAMTSSATLLSVQKSPRRYKISHFLRFVTIFILVASAGIYDAWRTDSVNEVIRKRSS